MTEGGSAQRLSSGEWARTAPTDADLRALIGDVLRSFADQGSVVIVSHAASFALGGREVLRVLVTASDETRARRVSETSGTDERDAARQVKTEDGARADYLKRFYGVDRELPTHFDIVINTDALTTEQAADLIASAAK
jgi:cytidylate kinase